VLEESFLPRDLVVKAAFAVLIVLASWRAYMAWKAGKRLRLLLHAVTAAILGFAVYTFATLRLRLF